MGLIKIEWEIGKDRGDKVILYYFWLVLKYLQTFNQVFKKERSRKSSRLLRLPLFKILMWYISIIFAIFITVGSYYSIRGRQDDLLAPLMVIFILVLGTFAVLALCIFIYLIYYLVQIGRSAVKAFYVLRKLVNQ